MALWEDRSRRHSGWVQQFPHDSAVFAMAQSGAGRNDPPKTPRPAPGECRTRPPGRLPVRPGLGSRCWGGAAGVGCAASGRWRRCCTFDRDRLAMDRRNHAETPRHSTPLKLSHVQSRSFCTWEPVHWKPTFQEEPRNRGEKPESVHGGAPVQCATPLRPAPEEPGCVHHRARRRCRRRRDGCGAGPLVRRDVRFALERALLTAHLECKMHLSRAECTSRRAQDRPAPANPGRPPPAPPRADPGPRTTTPGEKGSVKNWATTSRGRPHRPHDGEAPRGWRGAPADAGEAAQRGAPFGDGEARRS